MSCELEGSDHFQMLLDSSSLRVQLAFVFWNEADMIDLLKILEAYDFQDQFESRLHNRFDLPVWQPLRCAIRRAMSHTKLWERNA